MTQTGVLSRRMQPDLPDQRKLMAQMKAQRVKSVDDGWTFTGLFKCTRNITAAVDPLVPELKRELKDLA